MPRKEKQQPISFKFVFIFLVVLTGLIYYLTDTNDLKKIKAAKTFDEMLEYRTNKPVVNYSGVNQAQNDIEIDLNSVKVSPEEYEQHLSTVKNDEAELIAENRLPVVERETYNDLLDKLYMYPEKSVDSVKNIINQILTYKGYYEGTINLIIDDARNNSMVKGSYVVAYFDFQNGNMHINKELLYSVSKAEIIAIIAHELDHFDKIACLCKSMGADSFEAKLKENNLKDFNFIFWEKASERANIKNFDSPKYERALIRYINQNTIDLVSSYSDFYRLSEHIRNPLEISAYEVSDHILNYYGKPSADGPAYKLVEKFNEVDWTIYNNIKSNSIIENQRIAFFDYFFMKAIAKSHQKYQQSLDYCINNADGDLTTFWLNFERDNMSFYDKNAKINLSTYETMYNLLNTTNEYAKEKPDAIAVSEALKYKINTLLSNIVYPNALKNIRSAVRAYLLNMRRNKISAPEDELHYILLLLCMENNLYRSNENEEISLFYLNVPKEISDIFYIKDRKHLLRYIYANSEFKKQLNSQQGVTEQSLLTSLLNKNRLNVKVQL